MHPHITQSLQTIALLCDQFAVKCLDLFGLATQALHDVGDFDFIVELLRSAHSSQGRRCIALAQGLEVALAKPVDLVSERSIKNPYFAQAVAKQQVLVYERT